MGFSRQDYWSGLPFPSPGDLPNPEIEPASPALQANSLPLSHQRSLVYIYLIKIKIQKNIKHETTYANIRVQTAS